MRSVHTKYGLPLHEMARITSDPAACAGQRDVGPAPGGDHRAEPGPAGRHAGALII